MPKPRVAATSILVLAMCLLAVDSVSAKLGHKSTPPPTASTSGYKPVTVYDVTRDPAKDLQDAIAEATRTNKRILLEVGVTGVSIATSWTRPLRVTPALGRSETTIT